MNYQCLRTPALNSAIAADPPTSVAALRAVCKQYGTPLPAGFSASVRKGRLTRREPGAFQREIPSLCGSAGCAYIWLYNDYNGFGEAEYQADPYSAPVSGGNAYFTRYTKANNSYANWSDNMQENCGPSWCGYRYIYPIKGLPNGSWVNVSGEGTVFIGGGVASWGPVDTWNYITWH